MPNICLNVAVTDALDSIAGELESAVAGGKSLADAVWGLLPALIKQHKRILFDGNNYSDEWQQEAARRGLLNLRNTVDALPEIVAPEVVKVFEKHKVLNARELKARCEINYEAYNKTINIEAQLMTLIANRYILPAAIDLPGAGGAVGGRREGGRRHRRAAEEAARSARRADRRAEVEVGRARARPGTCRDEHRRAREVHARLHRPRDGEPA